MIDIGSLIINTNAVILENYLDWLKNILRVTGMTIGSLFLTLFIVELVIYLILSFASSIPFLKGIVRILELILLPGSLMHMVWHVYAAKKLNLTTEQVVSFGYGWSRVGIRINGRIKNMRHAFIFFWAPIMNVLVIIFWIIPGMLLFQWLDTKLNSTVFYWIWIYVLVSLLVFGLPDFADLVNPFQISIVKTPEFYLFIVFYVIIAPITLVLWGYGITIIFSLLYAIIALYEVRKISKKEEERLAKKFVKVFSETRTVGPPVVILADNNFND
ncbi:MAG: hypothetical protein KAJ76_06375 [Candidatus Heimdallarchaeota archaeon]|nr:hypothetical protein [Candidatus Heimdallarchaeota archaeon]